MFYKRLKLIRCFIKIRVRYLTEKNIIDYNLKTWENR